MRFTLLAVLLSIRMFSQTEYIDPNNMFFEDNEIVEKIKIELNKSGVDTILIYQAWLFHSCFDYDDGFSTFVIWNDHNTVKALRINNSGITNEVVLPSSKIFKYAELKLTGAVKEEDLLDPRINYLGNLCEEFLIYYSKEMDFFFELGNIGVYIEDESKAPIRQKYAELIKNELFNVWDSMLVEKLIKRKKFPEEY